MRAITGEEAMDASAIREYFKPLETWLTEQNNKSGEYIGWETEGKECVGIRDDTKDEGNSGSSPYRVSITITTLLIITAMVGL